MVDLSFIQCNQPLNKVLKSRESLVYKDEVVNLVAPYYAYAWRFRTIRCKNSANRCMRILNVSVSALRILY